MVYSTLTPVSRSLEVLTTVEQPLSEAAYETEINTVGTGLGRHEVPPDRRPRLPGSGARRPCGLRALPRSVPAPRQHARRAPAGGSHGGALRALRGRRGPYDRDEGTLSACCSIAPCAASGVSTRFGTAPVRSSPPTGGEVDAHLHQLGGRLRGVPECPQRAERDPPGGGPGSTEGRHCARDRSVQARAKMISPGRMRAASRGRDPRRRRGGPVLVARHGGGRKGHARDDSLRADGTSRSPERYSGISQSGNQRSSSGSIGSSAATCALSRSSRSLLRCLSPTGTKG